MSEGHYVYQIIRHSQRSAAPIMAASGDLELNAQLHSIIINESGLCRDYHRRQSEMVIQQRTSKRIKLRIERLIDAFGEELDENEEMKYKIHRLKRQLRYRDRLNEFERVLYSSGSAIHTNWTTELSGGNGNSHLHTAARYGHVEMVRALLNKKWDINKRNGLGQTALILACREGHVRVVKMLLKGQTGWRGGRSKLLMKDQFGHGCLGYATKGGVREGLRRQRGCLQIVAMLEKEWRKRQKVRRKKRRQQQQQQQQNNQLEEDDESSCEESSESDSDPESSCYDSDPEDM